MSQPIPGHRSLIIGRLIEPPNVDATPDGEAVATLRVTVRDTEEYVLVAFGSIVKGLRALAAGRHICAEGCWRACEGRPPELIVDTLTPL